MISVGLCDEEGWLVGWLAYPSRGRGGGRKYQTKVQAMGMKASTSHLPL